jgi:hypothetical protein
LICTIRRSRSSPGAQTSPPGPSRGPRRRSSRMVSRDPEHGARNHEGILTCGIPRSGADRDNNAACPRSSARARSRTQVLRARCGRITPRSFCSSATGCLFRTAGRHIAVRRRHPRGGSRAVQIGNGSVDQARAFRDRHTWTMPLFTDPIAGVPRAWHASGAKYGPEISVTPEARCAQSGLPAVARGRRSIPAAA